MHLNGLRQSAFEKTDSNPLKPSDGQPLTAQCKNPCFLTAFLGSAGNCGLSSLSADLITAGKPLAVLFFPKANLC
jgi:hypothetical protein